MSKLTFRAVVALAILACAVSPPVLAQCNECRGDYDSDGLVGLSDLAALNAVFGMNVTPSDPEWCLNFDEDGSIDLSDLVMILSAFGSPCELVDQPVTGGGATRRWQAGQAVSKFSTANLANGNLLTAIPIDSCDPVGPPIGFALFHNSAHAHASTPVSGQAGQGFELGRGWSTSYSARIIGTSTSSVVIVIEDDGTENAFSLASGSYVSPAGVHDRLARIEDPDQPGSGIMVWVLTRPDQTKYIFHDNGYLIRQVDSAGNKVRIARDAANSNRITHISSAAEGLANVSTHRITLGYTSTQHPTRLTTVSDVMGRIWTLDYNADGRVSAVNYPSGSPPWDPNIPAIPASALAISYDSSGSAGRISQLVDRDGMKWKYFYDYTATTVNPNAARFQRVEEWGNNAATAAILTTTFSTLIHHIQTNTYPRVIVDSRGKTWKAGFLPTMGSIARAVRFEDPLGNFSQQSFDAFHNIVTYTSELGHMWTMTYGPVGNLTSARSPLPAADPNNPVYQTWTYDWQAVGATGTNFYRLIKVTEPGNNAAGTNGTWTEYEYADPTDPTLVTLISEIPDGVSGSASNVVSETTIAYYSSANPNARGQLRRVTDANDVQHDIEYDKWGYVSKQSEGIVDPGIGPTFPYVCDSGNDDSGRPTTSSDDPNEPCPGELAYDANGNTTGSRCCLRLNPPGYPRRLGVHPTAVRYARNHDTKAAEYDIVRRPLVMARFCPDFIDPPGSGGLENSRDHEFGYDALGRIASTAATSYSGVANPTVSRDWSLSYLRSNGSVESAGPTSMTGPDGAVATVTYDDLGRMASMTRGGMSSTFTYDAASRTTQVTLGNGMKTITTYDQADRSTQIRHENASAVVLSKFDYVWNRDNTIASRVETDNVAGTVATVTFTYDARKRLIGEQRTVGATTIYDLTYTYDQLGNRLSKENAVGGMLTKYFYDADAANRDPQFQTNNNRLLAYDEFMPGANNTAVKVRSVKYLYFITGDVSNITLKDHYVNSTLTPGVAADYDWHYDVAFYYYKHKKLRMTMWNRFKVNGQGEATDYQPLSAREFRFDSGRARYATVDYDVNASDDPNNWTIDGDVAWTDYVGDTPYGDFAVASNGTGGFTQTPQRRYFGLGGDETLNSSGGVTDSRYWHGDLIGSVNLITEPSGSGGTGNVAPATTAYTAFGEQVGGAGLNPANIDMRYRYAGGHGYEADGIALSGVNPNLSTIRLSHVGERWYDPAIGRFVQRDPIGLGGGINSYAYVLNQPTIGVDASGMSVIYPGGGGKGPGGFDGSKALIEALQRLTELLNQAVKDGAIARAEELRVMIARLLKMSGLSMVLFAVHHCVVEPAVDAAKEFAEDMIDPAEEIGRRMRSRMGGGPGLWD